MRKCVIGAAAGLQLFLSHSAVAQVAMSSEFTYQGQLKADGSPVNDLADFEFSLWDSDLGGSQVGSLVQAHNIDVVDGVFTVVLDFGVMAFNGDARWLEVDVRSPAGVGGFATLSPRQSLSAAPYALQTRGLFVDDQQRVGIGNVSPQHPLSVGEPTADVGGVDARVYSTGNPNWNGAAAMGGPTNSVILGELLGVATIGGHDGQLSFWSDLSINPFGNVGIGGVTDPRFPLHNAGDYYGKGHIILYAYEGEGANGTAYVQARDDSGVSDIALQLRTQTAGTLVDAMNLSSSGNVAIGHTAAQHKLSVGEATADAISLPAAGLGCQCLGDTNGDGLRNGEDIALFVSCILNVGSCQCADIDGMNGINLDDLDAFVADLLSGSGCS